MAQSEKVSDQEFLDQLVDRLAASGHKLVFVDRGLIRFGKFVAVILGLFLLVGVTLFGLNLEEAADELHVARSEVETTRASLEAIRRDAERLSGEIRDKEAEIDEKLGKIAASLASTEEQAKSDFSQSLISLTSVVAETVPHETLGILREFYQANLNYLESLAPEERQGLHLLQVELLGRLADLEWFDGNRELSRRTFDQAVTIARSHEESLLAGELLTRRAQFERSLFHEAHRVAAATAKRLFDQALALFEATDHIPGQARTLREIAETYRLEGRNQEALKRLKEARALNRSVDNPVEEELLVLRSIAEINRELGDVAAAADYYSESVSIAEALEDYHFASEYALELASLQPTEPERIAYICTAVQYFDQAAAPKSVKTFTRKVTRIAPSFDVTTACGQEVQ